MAHNFKGKVVALTGGASGIGLETAKLLASRGAILSIADISQSNLDNAAKVIQAEQAEGLSEADIYSCAVDVRDVKSVRHWIQSTVEKYGKIDGACNFAGVSGKYPSPLPLSQHDDENSEWEWVIGINLTGTMICLKEEIKVMTAGSSIVNAASIAGQLGFALTSAYCASKFGVAGLTKSVAKEVGPGKGIRLNAIAPGYINTPMLINSENAKPTHKAAVDKLIETLPLRRRGEAPEVAKLVCFLLSDDASYITGAISSVDGGWFT